MGRIVRLGGAIGLALTLAACGMGTGSTPQQPSTGTTSLTVQQQLILDQTNQARAQARVCKDVATGESQAFQAAPPLRWNAQLAAAAQAHSQDMADQKTAAGFSHTGSDGSTFDVRIERAGYTGWTAVGENIIAGYTAEQMVDAWVASYHHCLNIMNPAFRELGVGYVNDPAASSYFHTYATQDFGSR